MIKTDLKDILREHGYTQTELAKIIGVRQASVNNWANGKTAPELETALRIAHILNLRVEDIWRLSVKD